MSCKKLPWAKLFVGLDDNLHIIKCKICSEVEGKYKLIFLNRTLFVSMDAD
jgi:hypothetical protein